jgi:SPP1 family phage portal protein
MSTMSDMIQRIRLGGESVILNVIADSIESNTMTHDRMIENYKRYQASADPDGVPVFRRKFDDPNKVNNRLNNAFDADIIDVKTGYMLGNPVIYELDKKVYTSTTTDEMGNEKEELNQESYDTDMEVIKNFNKDNNIEDLDSETLKMASICAYGARLLYIGKDGVEYITNVEPWECIFISDGSLNEAQYALRYYEITDQDKKKIYVEWYDEKNVSYFIEEKSMVNGKEKITFKPYAKDGKFSQPHMFAGVPLIQFPNNKELQGDCDKIYSLIDGYDKTLSDVNSEIEQFRLAYMAFYGMAPDEETLKKAKQTGAFGLPDSDSRMEFVVKDLNDLIIEHHLDRIEDNIYKFAKSVNFNDEAFGGNVSGIAMKFKMFGLESKCIMSERKFTASLKTQYKLLSEIWKAKGTDIDYKDITYVWTRNFPLNLLDEAQTSATFKGIISDKTRLGLLSFVDDTEKELKQMEEEQAGTIDLNTPNVDESLIEGGMNDTQNQQGVQGRQQGWKESWGVRIKEGGPETVTSG